MPKGTGVFSPLGELRAADYVQVEPGLSSNAGSTVQRLQHIPGDARTRSQAGSKHDHAQQSNGVEAALRRDGETETHQRQRDGSDGRTPVAPPRWRGERLETQPGGHEIVDRMHHQRIGANVCHYNVGTAVQQVRSSALRGFEATGGPASNVDKLKARHDQRLLERQRVWRNYGEDLAEQVAHNAGRREDAWLAWLEQQQLATAAHVGSGSISDVASAVGEDDDDAEEEDELQRMKRLGHWNPQYRAEANNGGKRGETPQRQSMDMKWPASYDPSGIGPTSSDPKDYAVDLDGDWNAGFTALSSSISEVESILDDLWNEAAAAEEPNPSGSVLRSPPKSQTRTPAAEDSESAAAQAIQTLPAEEAEPPQPQPLPGRDDGQPPRGRWAVANEGRTIREAMQQRDRGGSHVAIGEGAVTPGGQREGLEDRLMSSQRQMERLTNATLGDAEPVRTTGVGCGDSRASISNLEGYRNGVVTRDRVEDGLGFLEPFPEELSAEIGNDASSTKAALHQRREAAALYRLKARGRMYGSPSNAQRTFHTGAHVATSMGIDGAPIMNCFEKDKAVHERDPPTARLSKSDIIATEIANSTRVDQPPRRFSHRNKTTPSSADGGSRDKAAEAAERVAQVRQAHSAKRLEVHAQQHEIKLKQERRQGTKEARRHRYMDSPLVTGKPKVDPATGRISLLQPMAQRTTSFGSDRVGAPRNLGVGDGTSLAACHSDATAEVPPDI